MIISGVIPTPDDPIAQAFRGCIQDGIRARCDTLLALLRGTLASAVSLTLTSYAPAHKSHLEDIVQDAYVRLCRDNYRAFRGIQTIDSRVIHAIARATATTATLDALRAAHANKRSSGTVDLSIDEPVAEASATQSNDDSLERSLLIQKLDGLLPEICPPETLARDRRIFWLHHRTGCSVPEIATLLGKALSVKGVESVLHRMKESLKDRLNAEKGSTPKPRLAKGKQIGL